MENAELEKLRKRLNDLEEKEKLERKIKEFENKMPRIEVPNPIIPPFTIQQQPYFPPQNYPPLPQSPQINQQREVPTTPERPMYPSVSGELERGMQGINQGIQNIPHIMLGNQGTGINYTPQEQNKINSFKKWALWIMVSLVVGYATWRIGSIYLG